MALEVVGAGKPCICIFLASVFMCLQVDDGCTHASFH